MKILIVEDEPLAQKELIRLLAQAAPDAQIMACHESIEGAVDFLETHQPDLIFMDIQLADGQSFEIFSKVKISAPVIFTTAYDQYALQAFQVNGIDYLLKPIEPEAIRKAMEKYRKWSSGQESQNLSAEQLLRLLSGNQKTYKTRFMTTLGDRIRFVNEQEVAYFQADDEVVFLYCQDGKKYVINHSLEWLDQHLDPTRFFRINRGYICSEDAIADIHKHLNSRLKLRLVPEPGEEIFVSRARVQAFLEWLGQ